MQKLVLDNFSPDHGYAKESECAKLIFKNAPNVPELYFNRFLCTTVEMLRLPLSKLCIEGSHLSRDVSFCHFSSLRKLRIELLGLSANSTIQLPDSLRVCKIEGPESESNAVLFIATPPGLRSLSLWAIEPILILVEMLRLIPSPGFLHRCGSVAFTNLPKCKISQIWTFCRLATTYQVLTSVTKRYRLGAS